MSEVSPRKCPWLKILLGGVALGVLVLAGLAWGMRVTDARPFCSSLMRGVITSQPAA